MNLKIASFFAVAALAASSAFAGLVIDVIAVAGDGYSVSDNGKSVMPTTSNAVITLKIVATLSGTSDAAEKLQTIFGGFSQTIGTQVTGNLVNGAFESPFDQSIAAVSASDTDGDGYIDLIGNQSPTAINGGGYWIARAATAQIGNSFTLGTFYYEIESLHYSGLCTSINYVLPAAIVTAATFYIDGIVKTGQASGSTTSGYSLISAGTPVVIGVPEPSSLALLGLGGLALLAVHRRK